MPRNKKEEMMFTTMICTLMVVGMSSYNMILHQQFSAPNMLRSFLPIFLIALILNVFLVGNLAKWITFQLINPVKPLFKMLSMTLVSVVGMVTCMSFVGIVLQGQFFDMTLAVYFNTWRMNAMMALPLQLLIVGPLSRYALKRIQLKG